MFTGIIETTARILQKTEQGITIERPAQFSDVAIGSSIAVSGVCLTITKFDQSSLQFDVIPETLDRTNITFKTEGSTVNLERSLRVDGRFEGHIVQGHIEGVARVVSFEEEKEGWAAGGKRLVLQIPTGLLPFIVSKGSIALDGVSLTVMSVEGDMCSVALIPHTLRVTTLGQLREGDMVNIETDVLARYLRQWKDASHT